MNQINMRKKSPYEYRMVIFDLDGTLYYQRLFRLRIARYLAGYILMHPFHIKDFLIIKKYREVREKWEDCEKECSKKSQYKNLGLDDRQYQYVAEHMKTERSRVRKVIHTFMLETPLRFLPAYRDKLLSDMIDELHRRKRTVVIYSDYPVENKLKALGIKADACYTSSDERIGCMKPDPKGIAVILADTGCPAEDALMVGDRYEKDGLAAKRNGIDYIIVGKSRKERANMLSGMS
ncbi:MAG: HAD family hydrolase [Lachnospiraceae bacterium]|nr:HAD family hydrolase [Lachnospiraceae bacterium]